jgi:hypothetical protein
LQLAQQGDPTDDVTALWPAAWPKVELGRLEVTDISPTGMAESAAWCVARSAAYSILYDRRSKGE